MIGQPTTLLHNVDVIDSYASIEYEHPLPQTVRPWRWTIIPLGSLYCEIYALGIQGALYSPFYIHSLIMKAELPPSS